VLQVASFVPAAVFAESQLLLMFASAILPQHVARSAQVWAAVPLDPLVPLVPPLLVPAV
jgi:hypothetical protein